MRILYVSRESPLYPAGGIATYLDYMARAMQAAGHEVFLFAWSDQEPFVRPQKFGPFKPENVHVEPIQPSEVWRHYPIDSFELALSTYLSDKIAAFARDWNVDVIEASDFQSPALRLFQSIQTRRGNEDTLCVTYNHGFIEDFYEADQLRMGREAVENNLGERQQCRISDLVIAPSKSARDRIAGHGIVDNVELVREPYEFDTEADFTELRHDLTYIGRISVSKGIDKLIYFANAIQPVWDLRQVRLIGRIVDTPFRERDMRKYVSKRLSPKLREAVLFTDYLQRSAALELLEPGSICPSLGSADTFSYACVESIDRGLLPVVRAGTPMAEFLPEHMQDYVLDTQMRSVEQLQRGFEKMTKVAPKILSETRAYCKETLAPEVIAEQMGTLYERKLAEKKGRVSAQVRAPARLEDITILIPAYKPNDQFAETVDSLAAQSTGAPRVLICDDGTPKGQRHWFDYAEAVLPDCKIIRQPNSGLLGARNTLVAACDSPLSVFLDTDDLLAPKALENMLEAYNSCPRVPDAVIPQRRNFGESGEPVLRNLMEDHLHILSNDFRMTSLIKTEILRGIGFDATRRNGEADDWIFWLEFTGRGHVAVLLPEMDFLYRFHEGSMSWPWSTGQHVGSMTMVREAIQEMCARDPAQVAKLARALYAANVQK